MLSHLKGLLSVKTSNQHTPRRPIEQNCFSKLRRDEIIYMARFLGDFNDLIHYSLVNRNCLNALSSGAKGANLFTKKWIHKQYIYRDSLGNSLEKGILGNYSNYQIHIYQHVHFIKLNNIQASQLNVIRLLFIRCQYIDISNHKDITPHILSLSNLLCANPQLKFINIAKENMTSILKSSLIHKSHWIKLDPFTAIKSDNHDLQIAIFAVRKNWKYVRILAPALLNYSSLSKAIQARKNIAI